MVEIKITSKQEQKDKMLSCIDGTKCTETPCFECEFRNVPHSDCYNHLVVNQLMQAGYGNLKDFAESIINMCKGKIETYDEASKQTYREYRDEKALLDLLISDVRRLLKEYTR